MRPKVLITVALSLGVIAACWLLIPRPPGSAFGIAKNLIIVSLDDQRRDRLGFYGYERDTSPILDRVAREHGVVFEDAVTQFTSTSQSHKSLFSGRYPWKQKGAAFVAEILQSQGFATGGFTGGGRVDRRFGFERGFDVYMADRAFSGLEYSLSPALKWLASHRDERFFMFLHTYDPHCPWDPPLPYRAQFLGDQKLTFKVEGHCENNYYNHRVMSPQDLSMLSDVYDGNVRYTDTLLGPLFEAVEKLSLRDDTVIVVLADHGEGLGEHDGYIGHGRTFEEEIRVPLMMLVPGHEANRINVPAQLIDVVPTALAALGIDAANDFDGLDLSPYLAGDQRFEGDRFRATQSVPGDVAVRYGSWKLVAAQAGAKGDTLYRLGDAAAEPDTESPAIKRALRAKFDHLRGSEPIEPEKPIDPSDLDEALRDQLRRLGYIE